MGKGKNHKKFKRDDNENDHKATYNNYLKSLKLNNSVNIDVAMKTLSKELDIEDIDFVKLCLGEFYANKYYKEAIDMANVIVKKVSLILKEKGLSSEDSEYLKFWKEELENTIKALIEKLKPASRPNLVKNPFQNVFSSDYSFNIFLKLHETYKDKTSILTANYSFIFYAMNKDNLLLCSGVNFIKFLSNSYNIHIDRIDNRQAGQNKKLDLYESIKSAL